MKNLATIVAAALILSSSVQIAAAASSRHQAKAQQTAVHQRNNADAYASWPTGRADVYEAGPAYSGGYSAPAGR